MNILFAIPGEPSEGESVAVLTVIGRRYSEVRSLIDSSYMHTQIETSVMASSAVMTSLLSLKSTQSGYAIPS